MPSHSTSSPQLSLTVVAALWLSVARCGASASTRPPGCDSGKLSLDVDLPAYWGCPASTWPESTQKLPSIDTAHDAQPAKQVCMDTPIAYSDAIPSSGAYRPVMAQSGEYVYCPPQRWLNNLHHGGTVFLYHPCTSLRERRFLSALARSCLKHYIMTPHPQLSERTPVALVSWGRTLELSTVASSDVCVWLESTATTQMNSGGVTQHNLLYNLLLAWPVQQQQQQQQQQLTHQEENSTYIKESLRRCCGQTISSLLSGGTEMEPKSHMEKRSSNMKDEAKRRHTRAAIGETKGNLKDDSRRTEEVQNKHATDEASDKHSVKGTSSKAPSSEDHVVLKSKMSYNEVIDVIERELEHKQTHSDTESHHKSENTGFVATSQPQLHPDQNAARSVADSPSCDGCQAGEHCECPRSPGPEARPAVLVKGFPRTPRTDEAVWAAGALGFLLVLLTLSVLHTRLYRHWRTMPSLYWHDPRQDYDSVADVIRRRLRIAKRRRKRGRRQEYVLLPSSSSSDECL